MNDDYRQGQIDTLISIVKEANTLLLTEYQLSILSRAILGLSNAYSMSSD